MYKGYVVVDIMGAIEQMPSVKLDTIEECVNYVMIHKSYAKEVIIEDNEEYCILHAVDGKVVFPKEFAGI